MSQTAAELATDTLRAAGVNGRKRAIEILVHESEMIEHAIAARQNRGERKPLLDADDYDECLKISAAIKILRGGRA